MDNITERNRSSIFLTVLNSLVYALVVAPLIAFFRAMMLLSAHLIILEASVVSVFLVSYYYIHLTVCKSAIAATLAAAIVARFGLPWTGDLKLSAMIVALNTVTEYYCSVCHYGAIAGLLGCVVGSVVATVVYWTYFFKGMERVDALIGEDKDEKSEARKHYVEMTGHDRLGE